MKDEKEKILEDDLKNKKSSNDTSPKNLNETIPSEENKVKPDNHDEQNHDEHNQEEQNKEEELSEEITLLKEERIRLLAEMENLRKRFEKEKIDSIKFGSTNIIREMLSPGDNLERALAAIPKEEKLSDSIKNLVEGLKMVHREFTSILEKNGVTKIVAINEKFDHNYHQAMMEIETEDIEEGTVVQEIQTGYMMHDRLLRPAMVAVSKKKTDENVTKNTENSDKQSNDNKKNKEKN